MAQMTYTRTMTGSPGVFVNEVDASQIPPPSGQARTTKLYSLLGVAQRGTPNDPLLVRSPREFIDNFGDPIDEAGYAALRSLNFASPVMFTRITNGKEEARHVEIPGYSTAGQGSSNAIDEALIAEIITPGTYFADEIKLYIENSVTDTKVLNYTYQLIVANAGTGYVAGEQLIVPVAGPDGSTIEVVVEVLGVEEDTYSIASAEIISPTEGTGSIEAIGVPATSGSLAGTGASFNITSIAGESVNYSSFRMIIERDAAFAVELINGWFTTNPEGGTRRDAATRNRVVDLIYIGGLTINDFVFALGADDSGNPTGIIPNTGEQGVNFTTGNNGSELINDNFSIAIELLADPDQYDYDVIAAPPYAGTYDTTGAPNISSKLINLANDRKDVVALIDPPRGYGVQEAIEYFGSLGVDSSYVATYFPHVYLREQGVLELYSPSVVMILGMANQYASWDLWSAPAGRPRMVLDMVIRQEFKITVADRDLLYDNGINPIVNYKNLGMTALGQKNTYSRNSAINRLGVRFLLNYLKKAIESISANYLFSPIIDKTFELWTDEIASVCGPIKRRGGMYDFLITMDETTVTSAMVNNNMMPGLVQVKPTRSAEYIPIDIVVRNRDDEFSMT